VEAGKKQFVGFELPGRTLGVIGLGAIGVQVANAARALGMRVVGYDPTITVQRAWQLASDVQPALSVDDLLSRSDFVTFHVPLTDETRHMINAERIKIMKQGAVLLNFSRDGIIDDDAVGPPSTQGQLYAYVLRLPEQPAEGPPAGGHPAPPRRLHQGGGGELRRHGGGGGARLPGGRQRAPTP
jgi:D-3-phosphoglycerate dehydrogenase / 2-oxoglutarate reductase